MSEALGRLERPAVETFRDRRKLLVVFLVFSHESAPPEYNERCDRYWSQVAEQLVKLGAQLGPVRHIYHESVHETGEAGLKLMQRLNAKSHEIARRLCAEGAALEALEQLELAAEVNDWERFIMLGFASSKVADLVRDLYTGAVKQRNEHAVSVIGSTMAGGEVGLLFAREGHSLQFPADIEVFSIVPPAFDELHRWLRDEARRAQTEDEAEEQAEAKPGSTDEAKPGQEAVS